MLLLCPHHAPKDLAYAVSRGIWLAKCSIDGVAEKELMSLETSAAWRLDLEHFEVPSATTHDYMPVFITDTPDVAAGVLGVEQCGAPNLDRSIISRVESSGPDVRGQGPDQIVYLFRLLFPPDDLVLIHNFRCICSIKSVLLNEGQGAGFE